MYTQQIKSLYIGKSKLNLRNWEGPLDQYLTLGRVFDETGFNDPYLPDLIKNGKFDPYDDTFWVDKCFHDNNLYITGIPKNTVSLDPYRLKGCLWSSYYEDNYRGYLFQILSINQTVQLIEKQVK